MPCSRDEISLSKSRLNKGLRAQLIELIALRSLEAICTHEVTKDI